MRIPFVNSVRQEPEGHLLRASFKGLRASIILSPDLKVHPRAKKIPVTLNNALKFSHSTATCVVIL